MEDAEVIVGRTTEQIVLICCGNEDDREMQRELFTFVASVYLPFLPTNAEPPYRRTSELKPIATFMQHKCRILVIVVLWRTRFQLLLYGLFFLLFFGWWGLECESGT